MVRIYCRQVNKIICGRAFGFASEVEFSLFRCTIQQTRKDVSSPEKFQRPAESIDKDAKMGFCMMNANFYQAFEAAFRDFQEAALFSNEVAWFFLLVIAGWTFRMYVPLC